MGATVQVGPGDGDTRRTFSYCDYVNLEEVATAHLEGRPAMPIARREAEVLWGDQRSPRARARLSDVERSVLGHAPPAQRRRLLMQPSAPFRLDLTVWALRRRPHNEVDRWDASASSTCYSTRSRAPENGARPGKSSARANAV